MFETKNAIANGASEIDMVINIGFLKDGRYEEVEEEIRQIHEACDGKILKVIIETCLLTEEEKTALMIEIFGYIGCIFVIISMLMTSVVKLRVINTVGSSISAVYAMIGHSYPLAVVNASLVVINIYNLIKLSKADGNHYDMIRGDKEDSYLTYFIKHYKEDMKKYFLENTLELSAADTIYTVCCEGVPAGVLAGKKEGDALEISFDYTTPTYRDCSAGRFLYAKLAEEGYKKFICKEVTEGHKSYLEKMGFVKENGVYVKNA